MPRTALAPIDTETDWLAEAQRIALLDSQAPPRTGPESLLADVYRVSKCLKAVADGNYKSTAALIAGFRRETLSRVEARAKDGEIAAIAFMHALEKAEAEAEGEMVDCVRSAAKKGPQFWAAGMTYLERRQPDKWGKRTDDTTTPKVVVQIGVQGGDVSVSFGPSPQSTPCQSETPLIQAYNTPESDKLDYVNHANPLQAQAIDVPRGRESEAQGTGIRARDPQGDPTPGEASLPRVGLPRSKGVRRGGQKKKGSG